MTSKTNIEALIESIQRSTNEVRELSGYDHEAVEINEIIVQVSAEVELFFKKHVYLGSRNRSKFVVLISDLLQIGLCQDCVDDLHELRGKYNLAKHDPTLEPAVDEIIDVFSNAILALIELKQCNAGTTNQPQSKTYHRRLWFAAWDHYIGGDTEFSLFLPITEDVDFPPPLDTIYLKMEDWNDIKKEMQAIGSVEYGVGKLPKKYWDFWSNESDFLNAGIFEGDYKSLIKMLSKHERVNKILPELKRENDSYSMYASAIFATCDAVTDFEMLEDVRSISSHIVSIAIEHYAGKKNSTYLTKHAADLARFIVGYSPNTLKELSGPFWVSPKKYDEELRAALIHDDKLQVQITSDSRLLVRYK